MWRRHWQLWALGLFVLLAVFGLFNHEIWRDEWQAWLIARDSQSLTDLFINLRYEGHPALWHLLLFPLSKITANPWPMQVLHLLISTGAAALILYKSPFAGWQKVGLVFGYYFLFEYTVISRSYGLSMLLIFGFCALYEKGERRYLWSCVLLFLLSQTHFYGLVISGALGIWFILPMFREVKLSRYLAGQLIWLVGLTLALWQIWPPVDSAFLPAAPAQFDSGVLASSIGTIWKGFVVIPSPHHGIWNTNITDLLPAAYRVQGILGGLLFILLSIVLNKSRKALFFFWTVTVVFVAFTYLKYPGFTRHHGMLFIAFLAALWIAGRYKKDDVVRFRGIRPKLSQLTLGLILAAQIVGAGVLLWQDFQKPFTSAKATADFLNEQGLDSGIIYTEFDYLGPSVCGYLNRSVHYPRIGADGRFQVWNEHRVNDLDKMELAARFVAATSGNENTAVLLLNEPLSNPEEQGLKLLTGFDEQLDRGEKYYIYVKH